MDNLDSNLEMFVTVTRFTVYVVWWVGILISVANFRRQPVVACCVAVAFVGLFISAVSAVPDRDWIPGLPIGNNPSGGASSVLAVVGGALAPIAYGLLVLAAFLRRRPSGKPPRSPSIAEVMAFRDGPPIASETRETDREPADASSTGDESLRPGQPR